MKECYYHPGIPAAGKCDICGKYVCAGDLQPTTTSVGYKPGVYNPLAGKTVCKFCLEKLNQKTRENLTRSGAMQLFSKSSSPSFGSFAIIIGAVFFVFVLFIFALFFIVGLSMSSTYSMSLISFVPIIFIGLFVFIFLLIVIFMIKQFSRTKNLHSIVNSTIQSAEQEINSNTKNKLW